ncbi:mono-functional DNA-alkylating methyl methanesulfonate N-term-domain-containing protein [Zychaea mexicana]|uniref:mono-functional DNA-alkylating methyl methanesulfonate N-term-domain-containing protein n=1 Tax=Zychaea mexicana TaxID=64656 RepID=UPI0022FF366E|nr:mono-functional DNA-alkylating methyl methanesulfonate N-term-domain-containing protein [Zychaea mexicana]KAI9495111.1 mono-functional DNA-alkylating methyl methanesulfonate N-term-domain-containing protein [Zychaea mexicana]
MAFYKYVVTAQKPTATQYSVKGPFTANDEMNLILGKGTRIEIYTLTPDGLKPTLEFTSGEIGATGSPYAISQDVFGMFDPTCKYFATALNESMVAISKSDAFNQRSSSSINGVGNTINNATNPQGRRSSLKAAKARNKNQRQQQQQINLGLGGNKLVSMAFLHDTQVPTLAILYDDPDDEMRHVRAYELDPTTREFVPKDEMIEEFPSSWNDNFLVPLPAPLGGTLLVGEASVHFLKLGKAPRGLGINKCSINCYTIMDESGTRILLGDQAQGTLHLLQLTLSEKEPNTVERLQFSALGKVSTPSCLTYLDNDVVFIGSTTGDSQLVHLDISRRSPERDVIEVIEEFPNIGPITDFCIADLDKQGQDQLITCSGVGRDSSLRIIRNGVGLNELATIEISGVKGIWGLRPSHDDMLVFSFISQTRILQLRGDEMRELSTYSGFALDRQTLAAGTVIGNRVIQVTDYSVRLMGCGMDSPLLDEWIPSDMSQITVASVNPSQCVVSTGYGRLYALQIQDDDRLLQIGATQLDQEVSCIDITSLDSMNPYTASVVAVGVWRQVGVRLLSLPSLDMVAEETLAGTAMPRSILMAKFEDISYLLVALGDGQFYNYKMKEGGQLSDEKRSFLGKMPISLGTFSSNGTMHVFAASDKPSVIHSRNQKLIYSNVNLKDVRCATSFNSLSFPDAVALTTKDGLIIGQMEEIQKLHITKIPTNDTPRRIEYQESSRTFGVVTSTLIPGTRLTAKTTTSAFEIRDEQNFKVIDRVYIQNFERILSLTNMVFDNDGTEYYVLGTGVMGDPYERGSTGRLLVYRITPERTLHLVNQFRTEAMVENIRPFQGKLLASVSGTIHLYRWELEVSGRGHLASVCTIRVPTISQSIATYNDTIVSGDMLSSVVAIHYDSHKQTMKLAAQDPQPKQITSVEALSDDLYIAAAEESGHLLVLKRTDNSNNSKNTEKRNDSTSNSDTNLEIVSQWHFGERIQRFRTGSLGSHPSDDNKPVAPSLIFCTTNGTIGVIADLSADHFKLLWQMQNNLLKIVPSLGDLNHTDWRSIAINDIRDKSSHFIDGDLIESFLDLTPQQMRGVVEGHNGGRKLDYTVERLCQVVEELMSIHS